MKISTLLLKNKKQIIILLFGFALINSLLFTSSNSDLSSLNKPQSSQTPEIRGELLSNGDFSNGSNNWTLPVQFPANSQLDVVDGILQISITEKGEEDWHIQLIYNELVIQKNLGYIFSFDAKSESKRTGYVYVGQNVAPYQDYGGDHFRFTEEWTHFNFTLNMGQTTDYGSRFAFNLGLDSADIFLDNISLIETAHQDVVSTPLGPEVPTDPALIFALSFLGFGAVVVVASVIAKNIKSKRIIKELIRKNAKDRLELITGLYTILITNSAGLTLYSITNAAFNEEKVFQQLLGGLSFCMDTFIKTLQKDFMEKMTINSDDINNIDEISSSSIIRDKFHILITNSKSFKIFAFLNKQPTKFSELLFQKIIRGLENEDGLREMIDTDKIMMSINSLMEKFYPIVLLKNFIYHIPTIISLSNKKEEDQQQNISNHLNAIKQAMIIKNIESYPKDSKSQVTFWNALVGNEGLDYQSPFNIKEIISIFINKLHLSYDMAYEILWEGAILYKELYIGEKTKKKDVSCD